MVAVLLASSFPIRLVAGFGAFVLVVSMSPLLAAPAAVAAGTVMVWCRLRLRATQREQLSEDAALLADLTVLALTGGLGIQPALELASGALGGSMADEVDALLRRARVDGLATTMTGAGGAGRDLYRVIGRAVATGSALLDQVTRVADELHAEMGARRLRKVRRIPVAMLFPLTLLILPGFLLLTIAPALLDALLQLEI
jgi:hypothetical protein